MAIGIRRRTAAAGLVVPVVALFIIAPHRSSVDFAMLLCVLLAMVAIPGAPFGSWSARGRVDPAGSWEMPSWISRWIWVALVAGHFASGALGLLGRLGIPASPLITVIWAAQVAFAPAICLERLRPLAWCAVLPLLMAGLFLHGVVGPLPTVGSILLHLLAFDPKWIRPLSSDGKEMVLYDGRCGLCHWAVRFSLAEDTHGAFRFAPLQSSTGDRLLAASGCGIPPDSIVVCHSDGTTLIRSSAIVHMLRRFGGVWSVVGLSLLLIPLPVRDLGYRTLASVRHRLHRRPDEMCPLIPDNLRGRFDLN
jgi:predicted DCC family thiol-disulfide oxidoreductase YuxK